MIADVLAYYRRRLRVLGRTEWADPDFKTIPLPRLGTAFHLEVGTTTGVSNNQDNQVIEVRTTVRVPFTPTRKPTSLIDDAASFGDTILTDFLKASNRLEHAGIKNVLFNSMVIEPLAASNDNGVVLKFEFTTLVIFSTR